MLGLKTFRHGIHPPEAKDATSALPIRQFPFAPLLVVPLIQHLGKASLPVVREDEKVVRGLARGSLAKRGMRPERAVDRDSSEDGSLHDRCAPRPASRRAGRTRQLLPAWGLLPAWEQAGP